MELIIDAGDQHLPATLTLPAGPIRAGLIPLHGSGAPGRSFFLYQHLADILPQHGIAVLRYDRRGDVHGSDIPLSIQADDAHAAIDVLRRHVGSAPTGLWGFSQGAWSATLTAATHPAEVDFLIVVSACGISPAAQMRYGTAEQLRRNGYGAAEIEQLIKTRMAVEGYLRGTVDRPTVEALISEAATQPWFPLAGLPESGSREHRTWHDMDFEPEPVFARITCPVLAFYGETDAWTPISESIAAWQRANAASTFDLSIHRLAGCDHMPTIGTSPDSENLSPDYTNILTTWIDRQLPPRQPADLSATYDQQSPESPPGVKTV